MFFRKLRFRAKRLQVLAIVIGVLEKVPPHPSIPPVKPSVVTALGTVLTDWHLERNNVMTTHSNALRVHAFALAAAVFADVLDAIELNQAPAAWYELRYLIYGALGSMLQYADTHRPAMVSGINEQRVLDRASQTFWGFSSVLAKEQGLPADSVDRARADRFAVAA